MAPPSPLATPLCAAVNQTNAFTSAGVLGSANCQLMRRKEIRRKSAELINHIFVLFFLSLFRFSLLTEINSIQFSTTCNARKLL